MKSIAYDSSSASAILNSLDRQPPDQFLKLISMYRDDTRPEKIDLGVGVYRDQNGTTPVMRAVKLAEARLLSDQKTKTYLGAEGDQHFTDMLAKVALGGKLVANPRITGIQTPGGTGALRLAAEILARTIRAPTVWMGDPTWANHAQIFRTTGLGVGKIGYFDPKRADVDFDAFVSGLSVLKAGDVVLLHGCCHNPTGTAFSSEQWRHLAVLVQTRGLVPLIDLEMARQI